MLEIGEEVHVVGRAKNGAEWMAIQKKGTDYGFVYEPILLPKIEGTLEESVSGVLKFKMVKSANILLFLMTKI